MTDTEKAKQLREFIRLFERKLGILEDGEMACCGISLTKCQALVEIGRAGTVSLAELAALLNLDSSTMSRTVNHLVSYNLAERELDPDDRRYVSIRLTPEGQKTFQEIESNMTAYYVKVFETIPADKRDAVLESLQILLKAITDTDYCS